MNDTNTPAAATADDQLITALRSCGFFVRTSGLLDNQRPQVLGHLDNANTLFKLVVAATDCVASATVLTAAADVIENRIEMILPGWTAEEAREKTVTAHEDVLAERRRQIAGEGWTLDHDDEYSGFEMGAAAACYASQGLLAYPDAGDPPPSWPWAKKSWKPKDYRSNLVRAGALILAEIERLDRAKSNGDSPILKK
jgi:hypothetical protein